jgi:hypothetical protein
MTAREFRLEPGARIFLGTFLAVFWGFCAWGLTDADVRNDPISLLSWCFLFAIPVPLIDCVLWRLRLDEDGVTQTVYGWRVFWPWEVFRTGAVKKSDRRRYFRTDWPWWRLGRKIHLSLEPEDRKEVETLFDRQISSTAIAASSTKPI